jgi:hypothetical protein
MFYQHQVYVQVFENRFECLFMPSGKRKTIIADEPFSSKKMLVSDFNIADKALSEVIISNKKWHFFKYFIRQSLIVMHQRERAEEICPTEIKILEELAYGSGAGYKAVYVWQGPELTEQDMINGIYINS